MLRKTKAAGGVVVNKEGLICVVSQRGNSWSLPKGHIDEGETALDAAKREIYEETGLKSLKLIKELPGYERFRISHNGLSEDKSELKQIKMYLFVTDQNELLPQDPINPEALWVKKDKVAELLTHPKDKEFFCGILFELRNLKV
jgi:8-oxo-dGTP pyrophosphatase MutT (NUDIX family)